MTVVRSLGEEENLDENGEKDCIYTLRTEGTTFLPAPVPCSGFFQLVKRAVSSTGGSGRPIVGVISI
jgi:hypothetical protein